MKFEVIPVSRLASGVVDMGRRDLSIVSEEFAPWDAEDKLGMVVWALSGFFNGVQTLVDVVLCPQHTDTKRSNKLL